MPVPCSIQPANTAHSRLEGEAHTHSNHRPFPIYSCPSCLFYSGPLQVTCNKPHEGFAWRGKLWGSDWFFVGEHGFHLEPVNGGKQTRFVHKEQFQGLLIPLLGGVLNQVGGGRMFGRGLTQVNHGSEHASWKPQEPMPASAGVHAILRSLGQGQGPPACISANPCQ